MAKPRVSTEKFATKSKAATVQHAPSLASASFAEGELSPDRVEVELGTSLTDAVPARGYDKVPMVGLALPSALRYCKRLGRGGE